MVRIITPLPVRMLRLASLYPTRLLSRRYVGLAVALQQAKTKEFCDYAVQILRNANALAARLMKHGYTLVTGTFFMRELE